MKEDVKSKSSQSMLGDQIALFVISNQSKDGKSIAKHDYPLLDCYRLLHAYLSGTTTGHVMFNGFEDFNAMLKYHAMATFDDLRYACSVIPDWERDARMTPESLNAAEVVKVLRADKDGALFAHLVRDFDAEIADAERNYQIAVAKSAAESLGSYGVFPEVPSCNAKFVGSIRNTEYGRLDYTWRAFREPYDDDAMFFLSEIDDVGKLIRMNGLDVIGRFEIGIAAPVTERDKRERAIEDLFFKTESERIRSDFTAGANTHWAEGEDGTSCSVIGYIFSRS